MRVVVTGANCGIGDELVQQLVARGDFVEAGVRRMPEEISQTMELVNDPVRKIAEEPI